MKLTDTRPRPMCLGSSHRRLCFAGIQNPPKPFKDFMFIKYLTTFNLSHRAIYNRIRRDVLHLCRCLNPMMQPWPVSRWLLGSLANQKHAQDTVCNHCQDRFGMKSYLTPERSCKNQHQDQDKLQAYHKMTENNKK